MSGKNKTRKINGINRSDEAGKAGETGKTGGRAKRRRRAQTALLAVALGFATFAAFAQTGETSRPWKGRSGKVVVTGTLDVKRTLKESPDAASTPEDVYFRGENGKLYKFGYAKLCDADKARVDAALGLTAEAGADAASGSTAGRRSISGGEETSASASASANRRLVATPKDGALEAPSGRKAFLVGADDYADALDLACVKNDVEALAARLIEIGFKAENVTVLKTGGSFEDFPTKANVEARFAAFLETLAPGDFVVVYLSGHGIQPTGSKESFFAPIDVKSSDPFGTAVSIDKMTAALGESDARFRWLIVDACRNDPTNAKAIFKTRASGAKGLVDPVKAPDSVCLLQSCAPGKFSYEGGAGLENGVFTLSLLEALDRNNPKADANADGFLMFTEILSYVTRRTNELAFERHGASQIPRWSGAETTDFAALDDLLIDGIARAEWNKADAFYREACASRSQKKWDEALAQIKKAREINKKREEYKTAEAEIQAQVDATAASEKRAEADKLAEDAWTAFDLGGEANVEKAIKLMKESLELVDLAANRRVLKTFETELKALRNPAPPTPSESTGTSATATASGDWTGEYAAGTQKSLNIKGATYNFRYCPAGTFTMGDIDNRHEVKLTKGFWMLETEVTQALWESVMDENPSDFSSNGSYGDRVAGMNTANFPVENVSWKDCQKFIEQLNARGYASSGLKFRLPTEAEWEYACRAGTSGAYAGSSLSSLGWYDGNSGDRTHQVATKSANTWGLYDMHGNVLELCSDWYASYDGISQIDPTGPEEGASRVVRGGSWDVGAYGCRSANRSLCHPDFQYNNRGFRLVLGHEL